jgi:GNAT superfamily N-acetyltransferase
MKLVRTNNLNHDFQKLCHQLDSELNTRYGQVQSVYDEHNAIGKKSYVLVGYLGDIPIAIGCFKTLDEKTIEIKRMYVSDEYRRKGLSKTLLSVLENWGKEEGFSIAKLETGKGQPEAINLYKKQGYIVIENYGPYIGMSNSLCMEKKL